MMLKNSKEKGFQAKQEGVSDGKYTFPKAPPSSRQWSGFRNPRIVRVSRSFGGKDRHSKVCTIRGLRDRRIRLSVPTAIQLYDLQDKLRLGQPSKVIDWLLEVTKLDIDKLPPLQIPAGFAQFHQQMLFPHDSSSSQFSLPPFFDVKDSAHFKDLESQSILMGKAKLWDADFAAMRSGKSNEAIIQRGANNSDKGKWINTTDDQVGDYNNEQLSAQKLFPMANHSSLPNLPNNATAGYNYYSSDQPSCLSLSQFGNNGAFTIPSQVEAAQTSCSSSSGSPFFLCHSSNASAAAAALFTPYPSLATNPYESHIQFLSPNSVHTLPSSFMPALQPFSSPHLKPFAANVNLKQFLHSENNGNPGKDGTASGNS